ncbi:MAG TPA: DUF3467 domain-containing protein [Noviherbaspirillum sp.]
MAKTSKTKAETEASGIPAAGQAPAATAATPAQAAASPAKPQVQWDDAQMRTAYANVCNVFGSREEITLLFGTNQVWQPGQLQAGEVRVALGERIVLTPYTAKRLAAMLEKGLAEYERRFGKIEL